MKKLLKAIAIILILTVLGFSQSFFSSLSGYLPTSQSSKSLGLAFVSFASEGLPITLENNPSLIYGTGKIVLSADFDIKRIFEKRSFPVIDSFGDFLTNNVYVANKNYYLNGGFGFIYRPFQRLSIGINIRTSDESYFKYTEEVRGSVYGYYNRDPLVGYHMMSNYSKVIHYTMGIATHIMKGLNLGFSFSLTNGEKTDYFYEINAMEGYASNDNLAASDDIRVQSNSYNVSNKINAGLSYKINKRIKLGIFYNSPYEVKINNPPYVLYPDTGLSLPAIFIDTLNVVNKIRYRHPSSIGISIKYTPQNIVPTKFFIEIACGFWENFKTEVSCKDSTTKNLLNRNFDFTNNLLVKIGVEHDLFTRSILRAGFCHYGSPIDYSLNRAWITCGTAYRGENFEIDFSLAFTNGEYSYPDLFPVAGQERVSDDTVSETTITGKIGFIYKF